MLKKKKTTASGKLVLVKSVRRTRSHRMKFCVQRGLGALPSTSKRRGKSRRDFLLCGPVCINTGIACWYNVIDETKIVSSQTVIWLCRFPKHSNIEVLTGAESGKIACLVSIQELLTA